MNFIWKLKQFLLQILLFLYFRNHKFYFLNSIKYSIKKCYKCIAVSDTTKKDTRARGRYVNIKIENDSIDQSWRFGTFSLDVQADGGR